MSISINGNGITSANIADGAITNADIADVAASKLTGALPAISGAALTNMPAAGKVLQVKSGTYNQRVVGSGSTPILPHTNLKINITPSSVNSKILIMLTGNLSSSGNSLAAFIIYKDGASLSGARGSQVGSNRVESATGTGYMTSSYNAHHPHELYSISSQYLDTSGTTSSIDYELRVRSRSNGSWYLNGPENSNNDDANIVGITTITIMEVSP